MARFRLFQEDLVDEPFWFLGSMQLSEPDWVARAGEACFRGIKAAMALIRGDGKMQRSTIVEYLEAVRLVQYASKKFEAARERLEQELSAELVRRRDEVSWVREVRGGRVGDIHGGQAGPRPHGWDVD